MTDLKDLLTPARVPDPESKLGTFRSVGWFLRRAIDDLQRTERPEKETAELPEQS